MQPIIAILAAPLTAAPLSASPRDTAPVAAQAQGEQQRVVPINGECAAIRSGC